MNELYKKGRNPSQKILIVHPIFSALETKPLGYQLNNMPAMKVALVGVRYILRLLYLTLD
jgi:hypothetical protein